MRLITHKTDGSLSRSTTSVGEREKLVGFDCIVAKFILACKDARERCKYGSSH